MNLLLLGEGRSELGADCHVAPPSLKGAASIVLITRTADALAAQLGRTRKQFAVVQARRFSTIQPPASTKLIFQGKRLRLPTSGWKMKIKMGIILAHKLGLDGIIVFNDKERAANVMLNALCAEAIAELSSSLPQGFPAVVACPSRSIETWLLCDSAASVKILNDDSAALFSVDPESRPSPDDLKSWMNMRAAALGLSLDEVYEGLAGEVRLTEIGRRCPVSFGPFSDSVKSCLLV